MGKLAVHSVATLRWDPEPTAWQRCQDAWGLGRGKGGEGTVRLLPLAGTSGGDYRVCSLDRGILPFSLVIPEAFSFLLIKGIPGLSWSFCVKKDVYGIAAQLGGMHGTGFRGECELESNLSGSVQLNRWLISSEKVLPSPLVSGVSVTFEGLCPPRTTPCWAHSPTPTC